MLSVLNVATPPTAETVVVPARVPPPGLAPIATVTLPVKPVTRFPSGSSALTWTAGVSVAPAVVVAGGCTVKASCVARPGTIVKPVLVAPERPDDAAVNVYPVPVLLMLSVLNVATPATAVTVVVPASAPPDGFVPIATVTLPVNAVTRLPSPSSALTCTAGVIVAPAPFVVGCTVNTSWLAVVGGVILNAALVAPLKPVAAAVSVYPVPTLSTLSVLNVATPEMALTVVVPESVPLAGFVPIATVTLPVKPGTKFPCASWALTCTAGTIAWPAVAAVGCTENASWLAGPGRMLNIPLVPLGSPVLAAVRV